MSFLDRFRSQASVDTALRQKLGELILALLRDERGHIRVEDAISAAATIVGERCIDAAGDFPLRDHELAPGSRAFSTKANELICGDVSDGSIRQVPAESIVGVLRSRLDDGVYTDAEFPVLSEVFRQYAARVGDPADWGKVPLSVGQDHLPLVMPLQIGFASRDRVDEILQPIREDRLRCLRIATEALADILTQVASTIDHRLALLLAVETINGMSKTAPMTAKAMRQMEQSRAEDKK